MICEQDIFWPPPKYLFGDKPTSMVSKLNRNAIISGWIDFFCLVCDAYFETEEAAETHTYKQTHKANLDDTTYLEKYKDDCIRKVKAGYFCEYCNVLLSTNTKVTLHVEEKTHQDNRGFALLKYVDDDVAFNNVMIRELAWHGFSGDTCAICNSDVDDFKEHKNKQSHILNLVQGSIHFGDDKFLYRQVDDSSFQCLTCNNILASNSFAKHSDDPEHQTIYASCIVEMPKEVQVNVKEKKLPTLNTKDIRPLNPPITVKEPIEKNTNNSPVTENKSDVLDLIPLFQKNDINIDLITEKVFCKKCSKNMNFECNEILKHIDEHSNTPSVPIPVQAEHNPQPTEVKPDKEAKNTEVFKDVKCLTFYAERVKKEKKERPNKETTASKEVEEKSKDSEAAAMETYAANNKFIFRPGNSEAYCSVCDVSILATLKNMTKHVKGAIHKVKSAAGKKQKSSAASLPKMRMKEFVKTVIHVQDSLGHDVIINDKYCLHANSFLLIHEQGSKLRCISCEMSFDESDIKRHLRTPTHDGSMDRTPIVILDSTEFVREVRPDVYHCGWCHLVVGAWPLYEEHVKTEGHVEKKGLMRDRMSTHLPEILEHRRMNKRK